MEPRQEQRQGGGRRTRYGVLLGAVVLLVAWFALVRGLGEPSYEGVRLSEWLEMAYYHDGRGYRAASSPEFEKAMRGMGTNAVAGLVKRIASPGPLLGAVGWIHPRLGQAVFRRQLVDRRRGILGLKAMGAEVTNAIPVLLRMWPGQRQAVEEAINGLGSSYFSNVVQVMRESPVKMRIAGMHVLAGEAYDFKREEVVAVWMECLKDSDARVRVTAARLIGRTKPVRAQMAVEALKAAMGDEDAEVAREAKEAVGRLGKL